MLRRREILGSGIALAAAAVAGCERATKAAHADDPMAALEGKIFLKGHADYEAIRQAGVWNGRKPDRFPVAIALPENETDVIQAVRLAMEKGWKVGTRSGGHSWEGTHTRDGALLINLARMQEVRFSPEQRLATVSPSTQGEELNNPLREKHGLMFPSAHGYGVGLGGFVLHGGHGWNYGTFGLGCENLTAVDVVTARGELIHADERTNSDYLWAARGSGPGFFGVVVRLYLKLHPVPKLQRSTSFTFREPQFKPVLRWLAATREDLPPHLELMALGHRGDGEPLLTLQGTNHAEDEQGLVAVRRLFATCPVLPDAIAKTVEVPGVFPPTGGEDPFFPTGGRFVCDGAWSDAGAEQLIPPFLRAIESIPTEKSFVYWSVAPPRGKLPDMAYSLNAANYLSPTTISMDAADDKRCEQWTQAFIKDLQPVSLGGQFNDDASLLNQRYGIARRYLSELAASRMKNLLARHDPDGMFGYIAPYSV